MRRLSAQPFTLVVVWLVAACAHAAVVTLPGVADDSSAHDIGGEWVDVAKTTPNDSSIWVLDDGGDDQTLRLMRSGVGWRQSRHRYGRWRVVHGGEGDKLCIVRRPGRDAWSCVHYRLDTLEVAGSPRRHLVLLGYVGEHQTTDRSLVERVHSARAATVAVSDGTSSGGGGGYHPRAVQPERPSVATHAGTVAPGYLEVETGVERDKLAHAAATYVIPTLFKVGVSRRMQLSIQLPMSGGNGSVLGGGDVAVGIKLRVSEDRPLLQDVAILPQVKFATGGNRGTGTTDASLLLINSRTLGPVELDLNAGLTVRSGDASHAPRTATMWAAALGIPVRGSLGWALEVYGYPGTSGPSGSAPIVAILTGPTLVVRQELALDVGAIIPAAGAQPRALYAGVVANLGRVIGAAGGRTHPR